MPIHPPIYLVVGQRVKRGSETFSVKSIDEDGNYVFNNKIRAPIFCKPEDVPYRVDGVYWLDDGSPSLASE